MRCIICGNQTTKFFDEKLEIDTYYCDNCECIFKSPDTHQSIAAQKSRYDLHQNDEKNSGYKAYFQRFLDFVLPRVGVPKNALDFGCGRSSLLAQMLAEQGVESDFYDPIYYPDNLNHSKKYELIVSTEVFEHLHSPKAVLADLRNRLVGGGTLAIQTQFHDNSIDKYKKWYYRQDPTHIVFFTPKTFGVLSDLFEYRYIADNSKNMALIRK